MCPIGKTQNLVLKVILMDNSTIKDGAKKILDCAFGSFKKDLKENFEVGLKKLMKMDKYTTREYLCQEK